MNSPGYAGAIHFSGRFPRFRAAYRMTLQFDQMLYLINSSYETQMYKANNKASPDLVRKGFKRFL